MKKAFILIAVLIFVAKIFAQVPQKMSYQAVIRNSSDNLVVNTQVGMQISILQGSVNGTDVYVETQTPTTNANGLVSIEIGAGYVESGSFTDIDWQADSYFIKTETDPTGGTAYTITGTNQLLSVPYALYAKTAETLGQPYTESDPEFNSWDKTTGIEISKSQINDLGEYVETETDPVFSSSVAREISAEDTIKWNNKLDSFTETQTLADVLSNNNSAHNQIKNLDNPTEAQDAVTKAYVDALFSALENNGIHLVDFSAKVQEMTIDLIVHFSDSSLINPDSWHWDFGDGDTSNEQNPIHEYEAEGMYTVTLTVSNGIITQKKSKTANFAPQIVVDFDGNVYNIVEIGNQNWFAENLKTTHLNNGEPIENFEDIEEWNETLEPAYCWMLNDESFKHIYGALYNWYTVETEKLCPSGWHVPSTEEWNELFDFVGGSYSVGCHLKEIGTEHWYMTHDCITDEYGFSLLPGGARLSSSFTQYYYDQTVQLWTSSIFYSHGSYDYRHRQYYEFNDDDQRLSGGGTFPYNGCYVRCVKDK